MKIPLSIEDDSTQCFLPGDFVGALSRHRVLEYVISRPQQYLVFHGIIALFKNGPAGAGSHGDTLGDVYEFFRLRRREQVGAVQVFPVRVGAPPYQPTEQGDFRPPGEEHVEPEDAITVSVVEL